MPVLLFYFVSFNFLCYFLLLFLSSAFYHIMMNKDVCIICYERGNTGFVSKTQTSCRSSLKAENHNSHCTVAFWLLRADDRGYEHCILPTSNSSLIKKARRQATHSTYDWLNTREIQFQRKTIQMWCLQRAKTTATLCSNLSPYLIQRCRATRYV